MANKNGGARIASRKEKEEMKLAKQKYTFVRFLDEHIVAILISAATMFLLCMLLDRYVVEGEYLVPGIVMFVVLQIFQYFRSMRRFEKEKAERLG